MCEKHTCFVKDDQYMERVDLTHTKQVSEWMLLQQGKEESYAKESIAATTHMNVKSRQADAVCLALKTQSGFEWRDTQALLEGTLKLTG